MPNTILAALSGEAVLQSSLSAVVTADCVIVTSPKNRSQTVISLERLTEIRTIKTIYPGLLVLASGAFLIAAAAYCSKEGDGAAIPAALIGLAFVIGFFVSQRALIAFVVEDELTETAGGSLREAGALVRAVEKARAKRGYAVARRSQKGESLWQGIQRILGLSRIGCD